MRKIINREKNRRDIIAKQFMKVYRIEGSSMRIAALLATDRHEIQRHADNPIIINRQQPTYNEG